jgi:alpha-L-fucosidase
VLLPLLAFFVSAAEARRPSSETVRSWQDRKFGMFIHWGLYSLAGGEWNGQPVKEGYSEQIQAHARIPMAEYGKLAERFSAAKWDPDAVARLAKAAGMKYIVITSKHHDGFSMFGTKMSDYNVVRATPYGRDVVKELAAACARQGLQFGVYYSTIDWHFPGGTGIDMPRNNNLIPRAHEEFNVAQLRELMSNYGPLTEIWFDMGKPTPEQSKRFADTVHAIQPECMVSGRVFNHQGDFTVMGDNRIPDYVIDEPWQTPASIYHETWGYRSWQKREDQAGKANEHIVKLVEVVSRGGNYLLNIGPRGDGSVVEFEAGILQSIGEWLKVNGEAIYATQPQPFRKLEFGHATVKPGRLYLMVRDWPRDGKLLLPGLETKLRRAYYLADARKAPLPLVAGGVDVSQRRETGPVTVVVAEYDGVLKVSQPVIGGAPGNSLTLLEPQADHFYNYNGEGYYEPPSVYKLQWNFILPAGRYFVAASLAGVAVEVDGQPVVGQVEFKEHTSHVFTLTPPKPFVKGDRLPPGKASVTLRKE